jgi:hypothetical protein
MTVIGGIDLLINKNLYKAPFIGNKKSYLLCNSEKIKQGDSIIVKAYLITAVKKHPVLPFLLIEDIVPVNTPQLANQPIIKSSH